MPRPKTAYVYRVVIVEWPENAREPGWRPDEWDEPYAFFWPRLRNYLTESAAWARAHLYEKYGCKVTVERSKPVEWDEEWSRR